ncbi:MAG: hypothetical protein LBU66_03110 [Treponema sp.]|nr:hypothetical protein [Treponema sp.]
MAGKSSFDHHPMPPERCWIKYQLNLRGIKYKAIARKARRTEAFVSQVICGKRNSEPVEAALADALGYPSWKHLWAAAFINADR